MKQSSLFDLFPRKRNKLCGYNMRLLVSRGMGLEDMDKWHRWTFKNRERFMPCRFFWIVYYTGFVPVGRQMAGCS